MCHWRSVVSALFPLAVLAGCGAGDLTLPGDNPPASLQRVSGNDQQGPPGQLLDDPLVVQVLDASGHPALGTSVSFRFVDASGSPEVDPATVTTDAEGRAATRGRRGSAAGRQTVEARVTGADSLSVVFSARAISDDPPAPDPEPPSAQPPESPPADPPPPPPDPPSAQPPPGGGPGHGDKPGKPGHGDKPGKGPGHGHDD